MNTLELNLPAKAFYNKFVVNKRRNEMRQWRKQQVLVFSNQAQFQQWLDYTKWHKRPVKVTNQWGLITVTFLDWKPKK
jgi:hypothetical protein